MKYELYKSLFDKTDEYYRLCNLVSDWGQAVEHDRLKNRKHEHLKEIFAELERAQQLLFSVQVRE